MQIRHRSAYYDAFFTEALLGYRRDRAGLAGGNRRGATSDRRRWSISASRPAARRCARMTAATVNVITALAPPPHPRFSPLLHPDQAGPRLRHLRAGLRHHGLLVLGGDAGRLDRSDPRPAAARLLCRLPGARGRQRAEGDGAAQRPYRFRGRRRDLDRQSRGRAAVRQRSRSHAQSRHPRGLLPQSGALEDPGDADAARRRSSASSASRGGSPKAAPSPIRARTSIICRSSIAPISAAAMPPSSRCRRRRARRSIPAARSSSSARGCSAYVQGELIAGEMNAFDAALALIALGHLGADVASFTPALHCIIEHARRRRPPRALPRL